MGGQRRRSLRIPSGLAADTIRKEASENNDEAGQANSDSLSSNRLIGGDAINAWPNVEKAGRLTGSGSTRRRGGFASNTAYCPQDSREADGHETDCCRAGGGGYIGRV